MGNTGIKLTGINKQLSMIPPHKLDEVEDFISFILAQKKVKTRGVIKLTGIWEGKGFEKLNLKKELKSLRSDLSRTILKRAV
ncbi:MAG: hypothetical protein HY879_20785 [Deltaproteobacteria bacterium]|nr:hypothetical protein [Deltaproteobacteria bacterium]